MHDDSAVERPSTRRTALKSIAGGVGVVIGSLTLSDLAAAQSAGSNFVNEHSGVSMGVVSGSLENGANVVQGNEPGEPPSHMGWTINWLNTANLDRAICAIENTKSGKVLEVEGWSKQNGANVQQWDWHGGANQKWITNLRITSARKYVNVHSDKALEVEGWSKQHGANVQQWEYKGNPNQRWDW